jgi:hypothetical protein
MKKTAVFFNDILFLLIAVVGLIHLLQGKEMAGYVIAGLLAYGYTGYALMPAAKPWSRKPAIFINALMVVLLIIATLPGLFPSGLEGMEKELVVSAAMVSCSSLNLYVLAKRRIINSLR